MLAPKIRVVNDHLASVVIVIHDPLYVCECGRSWRTFINRDKTMVSIDLREVETPDALKKVEPVIVM